MPAHFALHHLLQRHALSRNRARRGAAARAPWRHTVDFPAGQTCCGQMHANTGYRGEALPRCRASSSTSAIPKPSSIPSSSCVAHDARPVFGHGPELEVPANITGLASVVDRPPPARLSSSREFLTDKLGIDDRRRILPAPRHLSRQLPRPALARTSATARFACSATVQRP